MFLWVRFTVIHTSYPLSERLRADSILQHCIAYFRRDPNPFILCPRDHQRYCVRLSLFFTGYSAVLTPLSCSCVAMDTIIRVVGAISLWSIEVVMQLRVYALYECSKPVRLSPVPGPGRTVAD